MRHHLRLALPPLARLTLDTPVPYALFDPGGRLLRSGEQSLERLAATLRVRYVQAILHPGDAIVASVDIPPLPARRLEAAVHARVEPMALSELDDLCIAHGPPSPDGRVQVAWAGRGPLLDAWRRLDEAGLRLDAIVPLELALPPDDPDPARPLALPADERWRAPLPGWSLARQEWRPVARHRRWRGPLRWTAAAALLWLAGLHLYAAQLRDEARTLSDATESAVRSAFPAISAVIDPLRQTRSQIDMLRLAHGLDGDDDFMPVALAAARLLGFAAGHVGALRYREGRLTLTLVEGYAPPADETALQRAAAAEALVLRKDADTVHVWHVERAALRPRTEDQP